MYFKAQILVQIRGIDMPNIIAVKASNDGQKIGANCDIVLPLNNYIQYQDQNKKTVYLNAETTNFFKSGDPVVVKAQYEGMNQLTVFEGYIYDFVEGMPLTIKCMDYFYFFNLGIFGNNRIFAKKGKYNQITSEGTGVNYKSVKMKDLLTQLITFVNNTIDNQNQTNGTAIEHVSLILPIMDLTLVNLTFLNESPAGILNWIKKSLGFNIQMNGNQLYFNLASNTTGLATLNTGVNVIKSSLQKATATFQKLRLKCWFIREDGTRDSFDIGDESGEMKEVFFYKVQRSGSNYETLAKNALLKYGQHKFSGEVETFLYPDVDLFYSVDYTNLRYPDQNGRYVVTKSDISLTEKGFRRKLKLSFLVDLNS